MCHRGLFIRIEQIPVFLRWARHLCALKYAVGAGVLNEFECKDSHICRDWMNSNDYHALTIDTNLIYLVLFTVVAYFVGALFLKKSIEV